MDVDSALVALLLDDTHDAEAVEPIKVQNGMGKIKMMPHTVMLLLCE